MLFRSHSTARVSVPRSPVVARNPWLRTRPRASQVRARCPESVAALDCARLSSALASRCPNPRLRTRPRASQVCARQSLPESVAAHSTASVSGLRSPVVARIRGCALDRARLRCALAHLSPNPWLRASLRSALFDQNGRIRTACNRKCKQMQHMCSTRGSRGQKVRSSDFHSGSTKFEH